tara:strand:+ start:6691 stop:6999 length:309 start_codon:yes stop_codon:yes gene_type:complete
MGYNGKNNDSEKSMKTATTHADRMALIAEVHKRHEKLKKVKLNSKKHPMIKRDFAKIVIDDTDENINHYTDASKYAKEYYGDILHQTIKYDNPGVGEDWGDY